MQIFHCSHCGQGVFFDNSLCTACGAPLGYAPDLQRMLAFRVVNGEWLAIDGEGQSVSWRVCANREPLGICNWMLPPDDTHPYCMSCRFTHIIPKLSEADNVTRWARIEQAKRRLFYTLIQLGLPLQSREQDAQHGLRFDFKADTDPQHPVLTGHDEGVITLNLIEADDARREANRAALGEGYRTLLGHFRHEVGHYYWDVLVANSSQLTSYRNLFGDERADYAQALARHYAQGPAPDWPQWAISAYATSHPWEDWAETWAHYLHVVDALDTASHWAIQTANTGPDTTGVAIQPVQTGAQAFRAQLIAQWLPLSQCLNAMGRSLGQGDLYPFVMPSPVLDKLVFVHQCVMAACRPSPTAVSG